MKSYVVDSSIILFVAAWLLLLGTTTTKAQGVTPCSSEGQDECALTNEACLKLVDDATDEAQEICYACQLGYVRVGTTRSSSTCVNIDQNLTIEEYIDFWNVTFQDETISLIERLVFLKRVAQLVSETNLANKPYTLTLNEYSAETQQERDRRNGFRLEATASDGVSTFSSSSSSDALPDAVDWAQEGKVTIVKNQLYCGCCWSVAAAGAVESKHAIDNNVNADTIDENFSFQQMISCNTINSGCDGGSTIWALQYANQNNFGGLASWEDYPFQDRTTVEGETAVECELEGLEPAVKPPTARMVVETRGKLSFEERLQRMKQALAEQPVAIAMKASCDLIMSYQGGVLTEDGGCACDKPDCLDHAVLMVGYNDTHNPPYLLIKNSWGLLYGEDGYFRVAQTPKGDYGLFGVLAEGVFPSDNEEFEEAGRKLKFWHVILIIVGCGIAVFVGYYFIEKFCLQQETNSEEPE